jgi:hypothetical protein
MKKQIEVSKEVRENIEKVFNCSRMSVWRALNYADDSEKSKRIRVYAVKNGGVVLVTAPECETIHDTNGYMRQWFANGALVEIDKNSGHADVYDRFGRKMQQHDNVTIPQLYTIQEFAAAL